MKLRRNTIRLLVAASAAAGAVLATTAPALAASAEAGTKPIASAHRSVALGPLGPLTNLIVERLFISDQVAASKFGTTSPIDDPAREQQELDEVRQDAETVGLDPAATVAFFQNQIDASKVIQRGDFAIWTADPAKAPTSKPDLTQIRTQLDQLTTELLNELNSTQHLRAEPVTCKINLGVATLGAKLLDPLDSLHRQGLDTATPSICS